MIFNKGSERLFLKLKKTPNNTFSMDGLAEKTVILNK